MACITLTAQPLAMATTQLARAVHCECDSTWQFQSAERTALRMSWVVVTGSDGKPHLGMRWISDC